MTSLPLPTVAPRRTPGPATTPRGTQPQPLPALPPGAVLTLRGAAGQHLHVISGRLWLTEPGRPEDHFLGPGHTYRIEADGPVVLECDSLDAARFRLWPKE